MKKDNSDQVSSKKEKVIPEKEYLEITKLRTTNLKRDESGTQYTIMKQNTKLDNSETRKLRR